MQLSATLWTTASLGSPIVLESAITGEKKKLNQGSHIRRKGGEGVVIVLGDGHWKLRFQRQPIAAVPNLLQVLGLFYKSNTQYINI